MYNFEEQRQILLNFNKAVKQDDSRSAKECLAKIKEFPSMRNYDTDRRNIPWKAHCIDFMGGLAIENKAMHPYIKEIFDIAVREDMNIKFPSWDEGYDKPLSRRDMEDYVHGGRFPSTSEGAHDTAWFLEKYYRKAKEKLASEGSKIFVPETFEEYPFLKDIADGITRYSNEDISYKTSIDGEVTLYESEQISKKLNETIAHTDLFNDLEVVKDNRDLSMGLMQQIAAGQHKYKAVELADFYKFKDSELRKYGIDQRVHKAVCKALKPVLAQELFDQLLKEDARTKENLDKTREQLNNMKATLNQERQTSVNAEEDLFFLTDEQRKENFARKKRLMEEHPIMREPCLDSMCLSYVLTKDEKIKNEMLSDLYDIRKSGENGDNREIAKVFKRILDKRYRLAQNKNLVALSKIDTPFVQPTKAVKKQVENRR